MSASVKPPEGHREPGEMGVALYVLREEGWVGHECTISAVGAVRHLRSLEDRRKYREAATSPTLTEEHMVGVLLVAWLKSGYAHRASLIRELRQRPGDVLTLAIAHVGDGQHAAEWSTAESGAPMTFSDTMLETLALHFDPVAGGVQ